MLVFITGASSGIGAAFAQCYATQGAQIILVGRNQIALQKQLAKLSVINNQKHRIYKVDINQHAMLHAICVECIQELGCPDIVIANAGVSVGTLTEYREDLKVFEAILHTNLLAMAATFHPFIAPMRARNSGRLVGLASVAGIRGLPGSEAYSASKAAVMTYLESLRVELKNTGIKVVTLAPGFIRTPMTEKNPYSMPFLMEPHVFVNKALPVIKRGISYAVIPWQMGFVAKILRLLPNWLYDWIFARATYKPRLGE